MGGIVSVALSLGSPPAAVSGCPAHVLPGLSSRLSYQASDCLAYYMLDYTMVEVTKSELATSLSGYALRQLPIFSIIKAPRDLNGA